MIIYKFTNKLNGKSYIGQTVHTLAKRISGHMFGANNGSEILFARALRKYSLEGFTSEILDKATTLQELNDLEVFYIDKFNTNVCSGGRGYNLTSGGQGMKDFRHDEETKDFISRIQVERFTNPVEREKVSSQMRKIWKREEYRASREKRCPVSQDVLVRLNDLSTSWDDIAEIFEVSPTTAKKWFRFFSIVKRNVLSGSKLRLRRKPWAKEEDDRLMSLYGEQMLCTVISRILNRTGSSIKRRIQKLCDLRGIQRSRYRRVS